MHPDSDNPRCMQQDIQFMLQFSVAVAAFWMRALGCQAIKQPKNPSTTLAAVAQAWVNLAVYTINPTPQGTLGILAL